MTLDSLKPREPSIRVLSTAVCEVEGVEEVNITVIEVDANTETIKIVVQGSDVDYDEVCETIQNHGAVVRSVDEILVRESEND
ncbi:MAG: DUF211 domain-containing protein [Candidatus Bathyarchaeota archaeon]|nr:MAG: DUF211 domain-containing protein [Candidatus Bathyarchaeota archaeon]